jgi:hypothetical protein
VRHGDDRVGGLDELGVRDLLDPDIARSLEDGSAHGVLLASRSDLAVTDCEHSNHT